MNAAGLAYLFSALKEKSVWIHAIADGTSNKREPMKDQRGFIGIFDEKLPQDVYNHRRNEHG